MHTVFGVFLILHGLITAAISSGTLAGGAGVPNPNWLRWWVTPLGGSWLFSSLGWSGGAMSLVGGVVWLVGGLLLIGAGLGFLGIVVPGSWWTTLALAGAGVSLLALVLYFHPYYLLAVVLNLAILYIALRPDSPLASFFSA